MTNYASKYGSDCIEHWHDRKRWCGLPLSFTRYSIVEKPGKWLLPVKTVGQRPVEFEMDGGEWKPQK